MRRLLAVTWCLAAVTLAAQNAPSRPNILLIVADDLGYGDLGVYGQKVIQTPVLDRLAADGMRFTDHYAGSTVCAPSRSVLFTGLHTGHTAVRGNGRVSPMSQHPLPAESVTIAEILKDAGYATGVIGKWGLGATGNSGEPGRQGVDVFFGFQSQTHAHNYYPEFLFSNNTRVLLKNVLPEPKAETGTGYATTRVQYAPDLMRDRALAFLDQHRDRPFFLAYTTTLPHANNEAKPDGMEVPDYGIYRDRDWPTPQKGHAAMITRLDSDVGALLTRLVALGLSRNTLVMFTSDNGPHREGGNDPEFHDSSGPLRGIKRDLYEGGIRVPLIARWPARVAAGSLNREPVAFWDYLPTFADLAGATTPAGLDGVSLVPTLTGKSPGRVHEFLYWEFHEGQSSAQAVRMGDWKALRLGPGRPLELYDLSTDIGETANVASAHPEVMAQIEQYLLTARTESTTWPLRGATK
jgi:arylsulfatase A-like enzyme